jgi:hypothetical protein
MSRLSGCGTVEGGVGRQDVSAVEAGKAVQGSDREGQGGKITLGMAQVLGQFVAATAGR